MAPTSLVHRPNVLIVLADDLGYGDIGCFGGQISTPYIDRLCSEGMRFTDAHSSSAVCSPSRYTLLTGRYHWRTRLQRGVMQLWEEPLIPQGGLTLASLAKRFGFSTAAIGKWHLGWSWPIDEVNKQFFASPYSNFMAKGSKGNRLANASDGHRAAWRAAFSQRLRGGPTALGFDTYFGVDIPNWPPYCFIGNELTLGIPSEFAPSSLFDDMLASVQGELLSIRTPHRFSPTATVASRAQAQPVRGGDWSLRCPRSQSVRFAGSTSKPAWPAISCSTCRSPPHTRLWR